MTMKYPTLRECIRKFLYFHKYSYGIVVRRHGILKIRRFQVKSVATLVHRKETQRTNSNRVARKIHSTVITCHDTPFSFFSFFFVCFLIFFIANIVTRRIIGSHFKSSALFRFSLSLSFYLSIPCSLYTFFFFLYSLVLLRLNVHTHRYGCLVCSAVHVRLYTCA